METIDADWIRKRLSGKRGEKSALATALGVGPDVVSKILKGERSVHASEIPKVIEFFASQDTRRESARLRLLQEIQTLDEQEARFLLGSLGVYRGQRREEEP